MKTIIIAMTSVAALFFASCATIVSKSTYPVTFTSSQPGVTVKVVDTDTNATIHHTAVPTTANLKAGGGFKKKTYTIEAYKGSKRIGTQVVSSSIDGWFVGNVVFGGIIGIIIDGSSGAMYALPKSINVATQYDGLKIVDYSTLTDEQKASLIKL